MPKAAPQSAKALNSAASRSDNRQSEDFAVQICKLQLQSIRSATDRAFRRTSNKTALENGAIAFTQIYPLYVVGFFCNLRFVCSFFNSWKIFIDVHLEVILLNDACPVTSRNNVSPLGKIRNNLEVRPIFFFARRIRSRV